MDGYIDDYRRVYAREFRALLGCGSTWFRRLELRGTIPPARLDPGGTRKWWPASEVRATLARLEAESVPATQTTRVPGRAAHDRPT